MNDRFKFRVWNNKHKRYIEDNCYPIGGDYSLSMTQYGYVEVIGLGDYQDYSDDIHSWGVVKNLEDYIGDCVIEQCTGLKDKNGKLIYEGDIVKIIDKSSRKEPFIGVVEYTNTASFEANCNGFYMHLHNPKTPENVSMIEKMFCTSLREIEVIGNIHEETEK